MEVFNTRSSRKEELMTQAAGIVKAYVCGPTVYDYSHIGHARTYINFDVLKRYLEATGYEVTHVQNFTDIEEKITQKAKEEGVSTKALTQKYIAEYFKDMDALNVKRATTYTLASDYVQRIIDITAKLLQGGQAYQSGDVIYFDVQSAGGFGELVKNLEDSLADRVMLKGTGKHGPFDFVLWRASKEGEEGWASPWGAGRPGWHTECVAMSIHNLGTTLDIHWGGKDLIYPHHECETLIAKSITGVQFVKYWMHNEFVLLKGEKMSKSTGKTVFVRDVIKSHPPEALRLLILSKHYRQRVEYDEGAMAEAENRYKRLKEAAKLAGRGGAQEGMSGCVKEYTGLFFSALDDDLETGKALVVVERLSFEILVNKGKEGFEGAYRIYDAVEAILGIDLHRDEYQSMSTQ
jgi:cysteinyl-tRNA synthetase